MVRITKYMPNFTGLIIDGGRLRLLGSLGSGAYGKVYLAVDMTSSKAKRKYYAVKCLLKPMPGSRQDEFQKREFKNHGMVHKHPNIVTMHKVIYDQLFVYVVLDLHAGGDLFTAITERKVFEQNDELVKWIFVQLIDAVQYCHDQGVFHRDIKPENVLVSEDGLHISLADFGLSTSEVVCTDFGCGSSYYMSPECIGDKFKLPYSPRYNDIWSLGIILTNMISGRNPWRHAILEDEFYATFLCKDDLLLQVLPISEGANDILKKIFIVEPDRRISLPELREDILKLDTFFSTEALLQLVDTPTHDEATAKVDGAQPCAGNFSLSSDEHYKFRSPEVDEAPAGDVLGFANNTNTAGPNNCLAPAKETNSGSTGQESEGPITPATKAVDPKVYIPDIEDEIKGLSLNANVSGVSDILSKLKKPFAKHTRIFRQAVGRFTGSSRKEASC